MIHLVKHQQFKLNPIEALKQAHTLTDKQFLRKDQPSGSTAVSVLLRGSKLYVAWLGDSACTLSRGRQAVNLMQQHKPERKDEMARITALGGSVVQLYGIWRVNGMISVSRSIGDSSLKVYCLDVPL